MSALSEGSKTVNIDSEVLLRLLPKEYKYKINNIKNLAKSDVLEEQRFKAYFEVNICDKEKADEFVKIFGKINGSNFRPEFCDELFLNKGGRKFTNSMGKYFT